MPTANDFFNNFTPGLFSGVASGLILALFFGLRVFGGRSSRLTLEETQEVKDIFLELHTMHRELIPDEQWYRARSLSRPHRLTG